MSISALNAKPSAQQRTAKATRPRISGANSAPAAPHAPQPSICHGVQIPWPRKMFDTNAAVPPTATPARRPSPAPAATQITVTGWTPGTAAKRTRPAAAAAPSVATSAISRADDGPVSIHATTATTSAAATSSSASAVSCGSSAAQRPAANAAAAAARPTSLGNAYLLDAVVFRVPERRPRDARRTFGSERLRPIGDRGGKGTVVGDDER